MWLAMRRSLSDSGTGNVVSCAAFREEKGWHVVAAAGMQHDRQHGRRKAKKAEKTGGNEKKEELLLSVTSSFHPMLLKGKGRKERKWKENGSSCGVHMAYGSSNNGKGVKT